MIIRISTLLIGVFLLFAADSVSAEEDLQKLVEKTPENGTLQLNNGTYEGNVIITKPITIIGQEDTVIKGDGNSNVIAIQSPNVHLENLTVTHSGYDRNSGEEYAAIKIMADHNVIRNIVITESFHGVYLSQAHHNKVSNVHVRGLKKGEIGGQGNGLHLYYSNHNILEKNEITGTRDGIFFDYSNENETIENKISHTRYGLHYMYSDDNQFYQNVFTFNIGGAAIMHSRRTIMKNNEFTLNQGTRSYGLLLQAADDSTVSENLFFQNQRGIFIDQSQRNTITENDFLQNQIGVEIWASSADQLFTENKFSNNIAGVLTLGGKDKSKWNENGRGNDWGHTVPVLDLDQNGIGDYPIEHKSSLYQLVEENELAFLFLDSPAIRIYEKMNELLNNDQAMFIDEFPLVKKKETYNFSKLLVPVVLLLILGFISLKRRRT
ncbi:nitrous oxide reductase family maturation protein NosD [Bacillus sp. Marseille-P3661]|uniref:nitrous oxide reductase family maturation protein NosD n=1 Tax=Bacillus sp. Marseille-P3661 TaxID=1936234 RepID=UPI000C83F150|nr:nitrous oxide reductase family maturation protein NosD [Bacillus sp. Marseille-P3661]